MVKWREKSEETISCGCGCERLIPRYNNWGRETKFSFGHSLTKVKKENPLIDCGCGCGEKITKYDKMGQEKQFVMNHDKRREVTHDKEYEYVYAPDHPNRNHRNKVYKHRLVMEEHLGRYLTNDELVHHKDRNPHNNDISNLEIVTRASHQTIHKTKDMSERKCCYCGTSKTYISKDGYARWHKEGDKFYCRKCRYHKKGE